MTKEDLSKLLEDCINRINVLNLIKEKYSDISVNLPIAEISGWLNQVNNDLRTDIIPLAFYEKVTHNIQALGINNLPEDMDSFVVKFNKDVSPVSYRKICEILTKLYSAKDFINSYSFFRNLGFVAQNTVLVGANGCGKTSLANILTKTLDKKDGIVIPAQKLLIVPTFGSTPNFETALKRYNSYQTTILDDKQTFNASKDNDIPYSIVQQYGAEYRYVLSTLLAERAFIRNTYCDKIQAGEQIDKTELKSKLDCVIDIWNDLIAHRTLKCDTSNNLVISSGINEYPAYSMSDGERIILYLIGRVLLAPKNALIIIDEPEIYLHQTIVDKLWNKLEALRSDCIFVYLTHNLEFAASRVAQKCWIKSYTYPSNWEIENIQENDIPEDLLLKILGSKKKILFCEGKKNSLDIQIFEILFSNYTITPVATCKDVINYTRAFNKIKNTNTCAYGIIDKDFREEEQLIKLSQEQIYSYDVAEIENLFLVEDFIKDFCDYKHEEFKIEEIKSKILNKLETDKQQQVSYYISNKINHYFTESHVSIGNSIEEVKRNFTSFCQYIDIDSWYQKRVEYIEDIIKNKDYQKVISIYNNKGLHCIIENIIGIKNFRIKAIDFLRKSDAHKHFKVLFPSELFEK